MFLYCCKCQKFVPPQNGKCPQCGRFLSSSNHGKPFVSGSSESSGSRVCLEPGCTLLDRFTIRTHLGRGSFGYVYLADDGIRGRQIALKVVEMSPCGSPVATQQLLQESQLQTRIKDHRHVIQVFDVHFAPWGGSGLLLLAMEYADGGTFEQWLLNNRANVEKRRTEGLAYFKQVCLGAGAFHDAHIVHLDIKPSNILFVAGVAKLADCGASRLIQAMTMAGKNCPDTSGYPAGTPTYMSPEQFNAPHPDDLSVGSDIYSLCIILFEILHPNGRPPFGGTYQRLAELHTHMPAPTIPDIDPVLARVLARGLEKDPVARYVSVRELLDDLEGKSSSANRASSQDQVRENMEELWQQGQIFLREGKLNEAMTVCRRIQGLDPANKQAKDVLEQLQIRYDQAGQFYATIGRELDRQSLRVQGQMLMQAVSMWPDHPAGPVIQTQLNARARDFRTAMDEGIAALHRGDWDTAFSLFQQALRLNPGSLGAGQALNFTTRVRQKIEEMRRYIDQAIQERNRRRALNLARSLDEFLDRVREKIANLMRSKNNHDNG